MRIDIFTCAVAFIFSAIIIALTIRISLKTGVLDQPNHRSSHVKPTPRLGGVGILTGSAAGLIFFVISSGLPLGQFPLTLILMLAAAALVGLIDDLFNLPVIIRMPIYILFAGLIGKYAASIDKIELPGLPTLGIGLVGGLIFSTLFIAWYTNLFNFMDGIDGISGATAIVTLSAFSIVFFSHGNDILGILNLTIVSATCAFLIFNFPPARTFMGDIGSIFLGMSIGSFTLITISQGYLSMPAALLFITPFAFDATFTLFRRLFARNPVWEAHHEHIYQQLCDLNVDANIVLIAYIGAAFIFSLFGLLYDRLPSYIQVSSWWFALILLTLFSISIIAIKQSRQKESRQPDIQGLPTSEANQSGI